MKSNACHPAPDSFISAPEIDSPAWDVISGPEIGEYFSKSPYAVIVAHRRGFVVQNLVTGGKHPVATYALASCLRSQIAGRYQSIQRGGY